MTWTPPDSRSGPRRVWWRLGHSAWVLLPILSAGCLSAAGFCYVGIRARRPMWWVSGLVYTVLANFCFFLGPEVPEDSVWSPLLAVGVLCTWMVSVVHALIINGEWLRWRASQHPWYLPQQQPMPWPAPAGPQVPLPPQVQDLVPPPDQYYPSPVPADPAPPPAFGALPGQRNLVDHPAQPEPSGIVDVNRADAAEFAALPGIGPDLAVTAVSARLARGGFHSIAEFAAAVNLAPHEFVAIRDRLTCSPPPNPYRLPDQPFGRIVDV